jgi:hypothetical protein
LVEQPRGVPAVSTGGLQEIVGRATGAQGVEVLQRRPRVAERFRDGTPAIVGQPGSLGIGEGHEKREGPLAPLRGQAVEVLVERLADGSRQIAPFVETWTPGVEDIVALGQLQRGHGRNSPGQHRRLPAPG